MSLVGNTAMHHLLLGLDVGPLVKPPYMPLVREAMELPKADLYHCVATGYAGIVGSMAAYFHHERCRPFMPRPRILEYPLLLDFCEISRQFEVQHSLS